MAVLVEVGSDIKWGYRCVTVNTAPRRYAALCKAELPLAAPHTITTFVEDSPGGHQVPYQPAWVPFPFLLSLNLFIAPDPAAPISSERGRPETPGAATTASTTHSARRRRLVIPLFVAPAPVPILFSSTTSLGAIAPLTMLGSCGWMTTATNTPLLGFPDVDVEVGPGDRRGGVWCLSGGGGRREEFYSCIFGQGCARLVLFVFGR